MTDFKFACRAKKIITVSEEGTIKDGLIIINNGKINESGRIDTTTLKYNAFQDFLKDHGVEYELVMNKVYAQNNIFCTKRNVNG